MHEKQKLFEGTKFEKQVDSTLGEILARGIRDDYGLPKQIKNLKGLGLFCFA